jgi:hypothetical protein
MFFWDKIDHYRQWLLWKPEKRLKEGLLTGAKENKKEPKLGKRKVEKSP